MVEIGGTNGNGNHEGVVLDIKDNYPSSSSIKKVSVLNFCAFHAKGAVNPSSFCVCVFLAV